MAAVTQTVTNYLGGVSNQPDDKKLPGQVTQAINAYPDPTFGLTKRPGFKFIKELASGIPTGGTAYDNTDLDNGKWFYYNRDSDEKYIGCIVGVSSGSYGEIHIWNAVSGNKCTVNYGTNARDYLGKKESDDDVASVLASDYDFITIQDTSIIVNKNRVVKENTVVTDTITNRNATVRLQLVEYGAKYAVTIAVTGGSSFTSTVNTRSGDVFTNAADTESDTVTGGGKLDTAEILTSLRTLILAGGDGSPGAVSGVTCTIIGTTLEIGHSADFTIQVEGGVAGDALTAYMGAVDNISYLSAVSKHGRKVKIQNTAGAFDTYWTQFVANDGTSGPGVWEETIAPGVSTGLNFSTMPHQLHNTAKDVFAFSRLDATTVADHAGHANGKTWTNRLVGDATTNSPPSFVGTTIQQSFYYNNRLGFLTADNVVLSQAGEYYNFYMITAQTASDADPIDISVSSTRPATLHGIIPTASGLLLFSQNQQFIMFSTDGNLTPSTALIRGLSNYRMDKTIDPVDVGTHINFISKTHDTAGYTRVFGMLPQGAGQQPKVVDVGRVVAEYVPATVTALTASPQNSFIAMYGTSTDKIYFYRTYNDGEKDVMQTWFNWQCPGNTHFVEVDSDTMYAIIKTGADGAARYSLVSATMTQTPEETIIVTADGQQVNPHMDFYAATSAVSQYPIESVTVTAGGSGYSGTPTVTIAAPASGTQATATATVSGNAVTAITITNPGKGYDPANPPAVTFSGGGGSSATATANVYDGSYCQIPFTNLTTLEPVIIISGNATSNFSGTTESGFTITPDRVTVNSVNYYSVPKKDLSGQAANVYVGYKYSYDVTLPKIYFRKDPEGKLTDYTASLIVSRCKFSIGKSSVVGFKLKRKGVQADTQSFTGDGSTVAFSPDFTVKDKSDVIVKVNGAKQILNTDYTIADHASNPDQVTVTFGSAPSAAVTAANVTTPADDIEIYVDQWYTLTPTQEANYYLGDDVPIENQNTFVVPIHQKSDNYTLRVFSDSPFPLALTSMAWEGHYSPRYYRRT
tara:strand:+ start:1924 stop:5013 length:3090 start_codon:yes stop_codon:yes gene_type:complete